MLRTLVLFALLSSAASAQPTKPMVFGKPTVLRAGEVGKIGELVLKVTAEHLPFQRLPNGPEVYPSTRFTLDATEKGRHMALSLSGQEAFDRYTITWTNEPGDAISVTVRKRICLFRYTPSN